MDPTVRTASADDVDQLAELEREARAALVDQRGGNRWLETHPERGDAWIDAVTAGAVTAAVIGELVVGYLVSARDGSIVRIDEVYVTPQARQLGFGDALIETVLATARSERLHGDRGRSAARRSRDEEPLRAGGHHGPPDRGLQVALTGQVAGVPEPTSSATG